MNNFRPSSTVRVECLNTFDKPPSGQNPIPLIFFALLKLRESEEGGARGGLNHGFFPFQHINPITNRDGQFIGGNKILTKKDLVVDLSVSR